LFLCVRALVLDTRESLIRCSFYISRRQRAKRCSIQWTQEQQLEGQQARLGSANPCLAVLLCSPLLLDAVFLEHHFFSPSLLDEGSGCELSWALQSAPAMDTCSWMASSARTSDLRASVTAASAGPTARSGRPTAQPTLTGM
jgi:hypothetical protein